MFVAPKKKVEHVRDIAAFGSAYMDKTGYLLFMNARYGLNNSLVPFAISSAFIKGV